MASFLDTEKTKCLAYSCMFQTREMEGRSIIQPQNATWLLHFIITSPKIIQANMHMI